MTGFEYEQAQAVSVERIRRAAVRNELTRLRAVVGADHPVRRRFGEMLISAGLRLSPHPRDPVYRPSTNHT